MHIDAYIGEGLNNLNESESLQVGIKQVKDAINDIQAGRKCLNHALKMLKCK